MQRAATRKRRCGSCRHVSNYCGNDYYCGTHDYCRTHHNDSITDANDCCGNYDGTATNDCCGNYDGTATNDLRCAYDNHDRKHRLDSRTACPPRGQ